MTLTTRTALTLALALMLPFAGRALAQETVPATATVAAAESSGTTETPAEPVSTTATDTEETDRSAISTESTQDPYLVRNDFSQLLRQHPNALAGILVMDPELLQNESYIAQYPAVAEYLTRHPEILENPSFYLGEFPDPRRRPDTFGDVIEGLAIFSTFALIAIALAWIIRTIIEQKRWNRLARTQTEVHNKILDRFGSSEELIEYMKSPAGAKFLEAAPITVRTAEREPQNGSISRLVLSIQIGVVVVATGLGMMLVSIPLEGEGAISMFSLGAIAFCIGAGFIASAAVSLTMSRRLGIWQDGVSNNQLREPEQLR